MMDRPIIRKEYYSIGEVCELVDLKPHVLRYWESQFPALKPSKNRAGNRVYQRREIRLIILVRRLLHEEKVHDRGGAPEGGGAAQGRGAGCGDPATWMRALIDGRSGPSCARSWAF
jgi:hypothetical protein